MRTIVLFLTVAVGLVPSTGWAQPALTPAYLNGMPRVEQVLDGVRGKDARETATRQMAAFSQLRRMIEKASDGRIYVNELTTDEQQLMAAYAKAYRELGDPMEQSLSQRERSAWFGRLNRLESSDDFRDELLERLFTREWADWYLETTLAADQTRRRTIVQTYGEGFASTGTAEFGESPKDIWIAQLVIAALLLGIAAMRETRRFGVDPKDPDLVRAGFRRHRVRTLTGALTDVVEVTRHYKTSTYDTDGKLLKVGEHKEITITCNLAAPGEPPYPLSLPAWFEVGEGDAASIASLRRFSRRRGGVFMVVNHGQGRSITFRNALSSALGPWSWPAFALAWAVFSATRLATLGDSLMLPFGLAVVALLAYLVWASKVGQRRVDAFVDAAFKPLEERLNVIAGTVRETQAR